MKSPDVPENTLVPTQFAEGDNSKGIDLERRITACLRDRIPDLPGIRITVFGGTAALRGEVRSAKEKRLCIECCRHVPGVLRVLDELTATELKLTYLDPDGKLS